MWAVVQLDNDKDEDPCFAVLWHAAGRTGSTKNDQTSGAVRFYHGIGKPGWFSTVHIGNKGIIVGLWREEERCIRLMQKMCGRMYWSQGADARFFFLKKEIGISIAPGSKSSS